MQKIHSRIATVEDAVLLADISSTTFFDTYHAYNTKEDMEMFLQDHFNLDVITKELNNTENIFLLVYEDEQLCGYAKLNESKIPEAVQDFPVIEIARIYSVKQKIGKGIGKILIEECIAVAKQKNKQMIWLGVWKENPRAIAFYQKNGFEIFGEQDFILGKDVQHDWLMKKKLS